MTTRCLFSGHVAFDGEALTISRDCGCAVWLKLDDAQARAVEAWSEGLPECPKPVGERFCGKHGKVAG